MRAPYNHARPPALPVETFLFAGRAKIGWTHGGWCAHQPLHLGSWTGTLVRALDAQGLDGAALARAAGIDPATLRDVEARVPREALTRLWRRAVEATGDPCFGLTAARYAAPTSFHALGYAVMASTTLHEALERIIRYRRLIGDVVRLDLQPAGDCDRFVIDVSASPGAVPVEAVDAFAATLVRQARLLRTDRDFNPTAVSLQRPEPADVAPFHRLFRAPIAFSQPLNWLEFRRTDLEARLPAANAELARQNDQAVLRYLARLDTAAVSSRVQHALLEMLPSGAPTKQSVARRLAMSPRNLQRHLADEGTSFKTLLNESRATLACHYIAQGGITVTEIAFVLGFADVSAFSRAFKRWTGLSPRDYAAGKS